MLRTRRGIPKDPEKSPPKAKAPKAGADVKAVSGEIGWARRVGGLATGSE